MFYYQVLIFAVVIGSELYNPDLLVSAEGSAPQEVAQNVTNNANATVNSNSNSTNVNGSSVQVSCIQNKTLVSGVATVEIVNSTRLAVILHSEYNITSVQTPANCVAVLFYSPSCLFSCSAAPYFNALARFFPDMKLAAIDALTHRGFNAQYGIFGLPTLILFHNGKPIARLNETTDYSIELFAKFIESSTDIKSPRRLVVTSADFNGPISSRLPKEKDYYLLLSWAVIGLHLFYSFYRSSWGRWLRDATLSAWREAEAQHHHID